MVTRSLRTVVMGLGLIVLPAVTAIAAATAPSAVDVLFEAKHLSNVAQGQALNYRFQRTVSDPKFLGEPFSDDITVKINTVGADGTRNVGMQVFTADRARPPQDYPDLTGNPVLVFYLDRAVNNFTAIASGNRNYLKGRMRDALREKAKMEPVKLEVLGKTVDGYKIMVTPFEGDPNAMRMLGYEGAEFTITLSEAVPGQFVEFLAHYESGVPDAPKLDERITLAKVEGGK